MTMSVKRRSFQECEERVSVKTDQWFWIKKIIFLIFWDIKASTLVVAKMHFVWPKVINIFFYEFLNFRAVSAGAIAVQSAKIANIDRALENKHLA